MVFRLRDFRDCGLVIKPRERNKMRTEKEKYEDIMDTIQEYLDELYPDIYEKSIFKTKRNFYKSLSKAIARRLNLIVDIEVGDVMPERELKKAFDFQGDSLTLSVTSDGNLEPVEEGTV